MSFSGIPGFRLHPIEPRVAVTEPTPPDYGCPACGYALIDEIMSDLCGSPTAHLHLDGEHTDREPLEYGTECPECHSPVRVRLRIHIAILGISVYQRGSDPWDRPEADRDGDL